MSIIFVFVLFFSSLIQWCALLHGIAITCAPFCSKSFIAFIIAGTGDGPLPRKAFVLSGIVGSLYIIMLM